MSGTTNITQAAPSFTCQTVYATDPGGTVNNSLESINIKGVANDALATIEPTDVIWRWEQSSVAAPGAGVVLPLGQNLATAGRWLLVSSPIPAAAFYQNVEALPLATTEVPEYDPPQVALQQGTIRFKNGDLVDVGVPPGGRTDVILHNQQVFFEDILGTTTAMNRRARLKFVASGPVPGTVPVTVTDDPVNDETVVTVCQVGDGITGILDVTLSPYFAIPNDRTMAAHNTSVIQQAIDDAMALGYIVWIPSGEYWISKGGGPDANGWTYGLAVGDDPLIIMGEGSQSSVLRYCNTGGAYNVMIHTPETADPLTEPYRFDQQYKGIGLFCVDTSLVDAAFFGIKVRKFVNSSFEQLRISFARSVGLSIDFSFAVVTQECAFSYNAQHGIATGMYDFNYNSNQIKDCSFIYNGGQGIVLAGGVSNLISGCLFQNNAGGAILVWNTASLKIDSCYMEGQCEDAGPNANISYPASGIHFSNDALNPRCQDVFLLRGVVDPAVPTAWTYLLDPNASGTDYFDKGSNCAQVTISNCYSAQYLPEATFIGTNAAYGLKVSDCVSIVGNSNPIIGLYADGFYGYANPFTIDNCTGFQPFSLYLYTFGGALSDIGNTKIDGVSRNNILGYDVLKSCMTRMPNAAGVYVTGEMSISLTTTFEKEPAYRLSGQALFAGKGITIDTVANPELANKTIYLGAMVYVPAMAGIWPTQVLAFTSNDGVTNTDPVLGARPFVAGWQFRSIAVQLPAAGTMKVGFSMLAAGEAFFANPVIAEVGAPYAEVVAKNLQGGTRCALNFQMDFAGNENKVFSANGATTVAGLPCTVANFANTTANMEIAADGSGLTIQPTAGTGFGNGDVSAPRIEFNFADFIPGYHPGMKVWVWIANPTNNSVANFDGAMMGIWDGGNFAAGSSGGYVLDRGKAGGGTALIHTWINAGVVLQNLVQLLALAASNNTVRIACDDLGHRCPQFEYGQMGADWPSAMSVGIGGDTTTGLVAMTSANARVGLGGQRGGSGTALTIKYTNIRIDYQP